MDEAAQRLLAAAEAGGIEIDEAEAARWIDAVSDEAHGGSVSIEAMREVDAWFKRALEGVPSIKAYLEELAAGGDPA